MRLHYHPVSTTSRTVVWFAQEQGIALDLQVIDLFTGEQCGERFAAINPNCLVPVLEEGDFRLTESSAILKYLADRAQSAAYPTELKARARTDPELAASARETGLSRDSQKISKIVPVEHRRPPIRFDGTLALPEPP